MNSKLNSNEQPISFKTTSLWERILTAEELRNCDNLEKLVAGCEIIAALGGRDLLAA